MAVNWKKIKHEYLTTHISQRKLAEKHGVPFGTIRDHAHKEKWNDERIKLQTKLRQKTEQKAIKKIERVAEENAQKIADGLAMLNDMLLDIDRLKKKMAVAISQLDVEAPEKTLVKNKSDGQAIVREKSGIEKAEKIAGIYSKISKSVIDTIDKQSQHAVNDDNEDDGLLKALEAAVESFDDGDDSDILPESGKE